MEARSSTQRFCPECSAARERKRNRRYSAEHREQKDAYNKRWSEQNRQHRHDYNQRYHAEHAEQLRRDNNRRYVEQREARLSYASEYRAAHREQVLQAKRQSYARNVWRTRCIANNKRAKKFGADGELTAEQLAQLEQESGGRCYYCGREAKLEMEHKTPLCRGGANTMVNVVMACDSCNSKKGAMTEQEFLEELWEEIEEDEEAA